MNNLAEWTEDAFSPADDSDVMYVDVRGYEGPLDLLLDMARRQKVDLAHISVLELAEQYLAFIETIRERRIEVAADYLVMAAWLTYLKSRLMVPDSNDDEEPSGEMMAAMLQFRLKRLEAMRKAVGELLKRPQLGRQIFARGVPEIFAVEKTQVLEAGLFELLKAYATQRQTRVPGEYALPYRRVFALTEARAMLLRLVGESADWIALDGFLAAHIPASEERTSVLASSFSASLEMVREGVLEVRQSLAFGPLMLRGKRDI